MTCCTGMYFLRLGPHSHNFTVYSYELQVSKPFRSSGLGRFILDKLLMIGKHWGMAKVMLTVLKSVCSVVVIRVYHHSDTSQATP